MNNICKPITKVLSFKIKRGIILKKKSLLIIILFTFLTALVGCTSTGSSDTSSSSNYKTSITWALQDPYKFAVEVDTYNGDIVSAGTYTFSVTNKNLGEAPLYDVYVETFDSDSLSDLGEPTYSVGGVNSVDVDVELTSGEFVYIIPYDLVYEPQGMLEIKLK